MSGGIVSWSLSHHKSCFELLTNVIHDSRNYSPPCTDARFAVMITAVQHVKGLSASNGEQRSQRLRLKKLVAILGAASLIEPISGSSDSTTRHPRNEHTHPHITPSPHRLLSSVIRIPLRRRFCSVHGMSPPQCGATTLLSFLAKCCIFDQ